MNKKLYKSHTNKMICGVCGGLGEFFGIDPTIIRLVWAILGLCGGTGIIAYLLAAVIIPNSVIDVCHKLKRLGDIDFLIDTLQSNEIRSCYDKKWYPESLYLLAMVDYLSRMNGIALCRDYDDIRKRKLSDILFPSGVLALAASCGNATAKQQAIANAIPEFLRFNIVESEIRNVN